MATECKWWKKKENGRLPIHIPEPTFMADFNHRVKVVDKAVYHLAKMPKKESEVTKPMSKRIKTNWGSMLRQIRHLEWEKNQKKIKEKVLAPIEHLFNNHQYYNDSWCLVLKAKKKQGTIYT